MRIAARRAVVTRSFPLFEPLFSSRASGLKSPSESKLKVEVMTYMAFATLMQDPGADMAAAKDLAERKYGEQGSSRTGVSIALTGQGVGAITVTSMWESTDACFAGRAAIFGDPEIQAYIAANNQVGVQFGMSKVRNEVGTCDGSFAIAVIATVTDHSDEALAEIAQHFERIYLPAGVNGARTVQMIAAGENTGAYVNLFYCDAVDSYFAASEAAWSDSGFVSTSQRIGTTIADRMISRMV